MNYSEPFKSTRHHAWVGGAQIFEHLNRHRPHFLCLSISNRKASSGFESNFLHTRKHNNICEGVSFGITLNIIWIYRDFLIHNLLQEAHRTDSPHLAIIHLVTDDIRIK